MTVVNPCDNQDEREAAMAGADPEFKKIAADIVATIPFIEPTVLQQQQYEAALAASRKTNKEFRLKSLLLAGLYIEDTLNSDPTVEKDAALRLVANDFLYLACWLVRSLKRRGGDEISPARTALVAYGMAQHVLGLTWDAGTADILTSDSGSLREELNACLAEQVTGPYVDIVFDGGPSHESGRFIEVEDADGKSIAFGEWIHRPDGFWALRVPKP